MMLTHHLDDATLVRYASGTLDEAFSVVAAAHIAMCPSCQRALRVAEEIGGCLLADGEAAEMPDDSFERLMQKLDRADCNAAGPDPANANAGAEPGDVPAPLRRYIGPWLDGVGWKFVAPGVRKHTLAPESRTNSSLYMLRIAAGTAVPEHGHGGSELTLVLSGAYRDGLGQFGRGDVADLDEHVEHKIYVEPGGPCICLVATEAPTKFKGIFSRLLQPLTGI